MSKNQIEVERYKFGRIVRELMKMSGKTFREVIRAETGQVLSGAMNATKVGSKKKIIEHQMPIGMKYQRATGQKKFGKINGRFYYLGGRQRNENYSQLIENRQRRTDSGLQNRGLAASQFYLMSKMLNLKLPRPPRNQAIVNQSHNKFRKFLSPKEINNSKDDYTIVLESNTKANTWTGGGKFKSAGLTLQNKVSGRAKMFTQAIRKEFIKDIKFRTKNYPLLFS